VAATGGDSALYDQYVARMKASVASPEEYYRFFNALAAFRDPALRARTLKFALSADARTQDTPLHMAQLLVSQSSQDETWAFVKSEWNAVVSKVGSFQGMPAVANAVGAFCSAAKSAEIKAFFDAHPVPEASRTLQQSLERIATCVAIKERQSPAFGKWLAMH
jgi:aminopeptidase N